MKKIFILAIMTIVLVGCSANNDNTTDNSTEKIDGANPVVTITMENGKEITMELYKDVAPNTVNNFVTLINEGYYDGTTFHRVIPGFMIQGGDPDGNGTGGPGYGIPGEFTSNGFTNDLSHERGIVSMARTQIPDSAGSQFFIVVADSDFLDGEYAAFGKVLTGMDVVDEIVGVNRDSSDKPTEAQVIKTMTVDTFGNTYPTPKKTGE